MGSGFRRVLSANDREFRGRPHQRPYQLILQLEEIDHRTSQVRRPQFNGFIERFHRRLLDNHLRVKGRTTWYEAVEEMEQDLEAYLETYSRKRPHWGRGMNRWPLCQGSNVSLKDVWSPDLEREAREGMELYGLFKSLRNRQAHSREYPRGPEGVKEPAKSSPKVRRNPQCSCRSGKKYKHCCGFERA